jgi:hypothetical protein
LNDQLLMEWYRWRWSKVFAVAESASEPVVPDALICVLPGEAGPSMNLDELLTQNQARGGDEQGLAPTEVVRLRAFTAGTLTEPLRDQFGDDAISIGDLVASLHRVRLKVLKMAERYDPLYGELPEGQYLASIRTQFLVNYDPSAQPEKIIEFYMIACRKLNRLLLAKGGRIQSAISSATRILTALESLDAVMGLLNADSQSYLNLDRACGVHRMGLTVDGLQQKINLRIAARTARDWVQADALQIELAGLGVTLNDSEGVTEWWIPYSA